MSAASPDGILIAYDGSAPAADAVAAAGRLFPGARAVVLTVWASVRPGAAAARVALSQDVIEQAVRNLDGAAQQVAELTSHEGAERARAAGLDASPVTARAERSVAAAIVQLADERDASAIVVGSRGRSSVRSAVLGSVSNALVHHCDRPVLVVHPPGDLTLEQGLGGVRVEALEVRAQPE
jgi:nucleotide-binding universal stress UspA family protein